MSRTVRHLSRLWPKRCAPQGAFIALVALQLSTTSCSSSAAATSAHPEPTERGAEGESWSYAHVYDPAVPLRLSQASWRQPDPALERAGLPQIRCRLLDVAVRQAPTEIDGKGVMAWWATYFVKLEVHWQLHCNPTYVSLAPAGDGRSLSSHVAV